MAGLVTLIAFIAGLIAALFLYGRKHQRWTNERRSRAVASTAADDLRPARLGIDQRPSWRRHATGRDRPPRASPR